MRIPIQIIIEYSEEDGLYLAVVPQLNDLATFGETEDIAFENMKDAIRLYFQPIALDRLQTSNKTKVRDIDLNQVIPA